MGGEGSGVRSGLLVSSGAPHSQQVASRGEASAERERTPGKLDLVEVVLEQLAEAGMAQLAQRLDLDLADALAGDAEGAANLL